MKFKWESQFREIGQVSLVFSPFLIWRLLKLVTPFLVKNDSSVKRNLFHEAVVFNKSVYKLCANFYSGNIIVFEQFLNNFKIKWWE